VNGPGAADRLLARLIFASAILLATHFALLPDLPSDWRKPGSPPLYLIGAAGGLLLLVSAGFLLAKRTGRGGSPVGWFEAHVLTGTLGAVLAAVHSAGRLRYAPALLLLALAGLLALGVWARVRLSRRMAATFAEKAEGLLAPDPELRERLRAILREKELLLARLDPSAREGTFSPTLAHWLRSPLRSIAYARLAGEESRLLGARRAVPPAQAHWRRVHIALALLFLAGLLGHVAVVTFFAGYVSGGGEIYWPHLAAW
jgi:hypothetical protein